MYAEVFEYPTCPASSNAFIGTFRPRLALIVLEFADETVWVVVIESAALEDKLGSQ